MSSNRKRAPEAGTGRRPPVSRGKPARRKPLSAEPGARRQPLRSKPVGSDKPSRGKPATRGKPARRPAPGRRDRLPPPKPSAPEGDRLQKVLAAAGIASRRASEQLIAEGRVSVNGEVVRVQGMRVDPARARIEVDGNRIATGVDHEYLMLNKPAGVVTTVRDPQGRRTVMHLVNAKGRVFPVGRLDADTLGLLLLTDHGELAHRLTHPRFQVPRVYVADVSGSIGRPVVAKLLKGVRLEDGVARVADARILRSSGGRSQVELTLAEGKKRQIRRMLEAVGHPVIDLVRTRFGPLALGRLPSGGARALTPREVGMLLDSAGL